MNCSTCGAVLDTDATFCDSCGTDIVAGTVAGAAGGVVAVTIGREADNMIPIEADQVSRYHAVVKITGAQMVIEDLGSSNGVSVNGIPVKSAPFSLSDKVMFGSFSFNTGLLGPYIAMAGAASPKPKAPSPGKEVLAKAAAPVASKAMSKPLLVGLVAGGACVIAAVVAVVVVKGDGGENTAMVADTSRPEPPTAGELMAPRFVFCPARGTEGRYYTLRWTGATVSERYVLQFKRIGGRSPIMAWTKSTNAELRAPTYDWGVNENEGRPEYRFRVKGVADDGRESAFSETCSVQVDRAEFTAPRFTSCPPRAQEGVYYNLRWSAPDGAARYELQFRRLGGSSPITSWRRSTNARLTSPRYHWGTNEGEGRPVYEFRVRAVGADGRRSSFSQRCRSQVVARGAAAPAQPSKGPFDGASWVGTYVNGMRVYDVNCYVRRDLLRCQMDHDRTEFVNLRGASRHCKRSGGGIRCRRGREDWNLDATD